MKENEWLEQKLSTTDSVNLRHYKDMLSHVGFWNLGEEFKALIFKHYEGYADNPQLVSDDNIRFAWSLESAFDDLSSKME